MKNKFILMIALGTIASAASAQKSDTTSLNKVIVSGTLVPAKKDAVTQSVTVISGDDLRVRGVMRVSDALEEITGFMTVMSGSYGSVTSGFLRGGESRYTKVLIDNVPVNNIGGSFDFSHLTTDNIDRIEVLRGPGSVIYGADAMTGVVRIFTRQGDPNKRPSVTASARGGTYNSRDGDLSLVGGSKMPAGTADYSLGGGWHTTDGVNSFNNQYQNGTLSGSVGYKLGSTSARLSSRYTTAESHYPTGFTPAPVDSDSYRVQHRLTTGLEISRFLKDYLQVALSGASNDVIDFTHDIDGTTTRTRSVNKTDSYRRGGDLLATLYLPMEHTFTFGGSYQKEYSNGTNSSCTYASSAAPCDPTPSGTPNPGARKTTAYYAELAGVYGLLSYTLSGRMDDPDDFDRAGTYRAGISAEFMPHTFLIGSFSTAFNAPSLDQTQGSAFNAPNSNLQPERNHAWEAGLRRKIFGDKAEASASYYNQRFTQKVVYVFGSPSVYQNIDKAQSNGVDIDASVKDVFGMDLNAGYNFNKARVSEGSSASGANNGDELIRRPSHSGHFGVTHKVAHFGSFNATAHYVGSRLDQDFSTFPSPTVVLKPYTKVDFATTIDALRTPSGVPVALTVRLENAFNKKYENVYGYGAPRRVLLAGLRFNLGPSRLRPDP